MNREGFEEHVILKATAGKRGNYICNDIYNLSKNNDRTGMNTIARMNV